MYNTNIAELYKWRLDKMQLWEFCLVLFKHGRIVPADFHSITFTHITVYFKKNKDLVQYCQLLASNFQICVCLLFNYTMER